MSRAISIRLPKSVIADFKLMAAYTGTKYQTLMQEVLHRLRGENQVNGNNMKVGDAVEFRSDSQTEKGPSTGRVTARDGDKVCIRHSDHLGELFHAPSINVEKLATHHKGGPLWILS